MPTMISRFGLVGLALVALAAAPAALAETVTYKADLKGSSEVPPTPSSGTGTVSANYDTATKSLTWTVNYSGLTGAATAAHFHGPAPADKNAGVVVPITGSLASPIQGSATLTDAQAADLAAGNWYFNIHTNDHKAGEIRGQLHRGT